MSKLKLSKKAEQVIDKCDPCLFGPLRNWLLSRGSSSVSAVKMQVALDMLYQCLIWREDPEECFGQADVDMHLRCLGEKRGEWLYCRFTDKELELLKQNALRYLP